MCYATSPNTPNNSSIPPFKRELSHALPTKPYLFFPAIVPYPVKTSPSCLEDRFNPTYIPSSLSRFRTSFPVYLSFLATQPLISGETYRKKVTKTFLVYYYHTDIQIDTYNAIIFK